MKPATLKKSTLLVDTIACGVTTTILTTTSIIYAEIIIIRFFSLIFGIMLVSYLYLYASLVWKNKILKQLLIWLNIVLGITTLFNIFIIVLRAQL